MGVPVKKRNSGQRSIFPAVLRGGFFFALMRLLLLAALLCAPAHAALRCDATVKRPERYQALFDRAPARVRRVDVTLSIRPKGLTGQGGYWTNYPGKGPLIGIDREDNVMSFAHELGHAVASQTWSTEDAAAWRTFYRANRNRLPQPPSGSRDKAIDGAWAETFSHWLMGKKLDPRVRAWFEERYADRRAD